MMSFRDMTLAQFAQGITLPVAAAGLLWVHNYYLGEIQAAVVGVEVRMIERDIDDLEGTKALYEARLQNEGALDAVASNRYTILLGKIEDAKQEIIRLENSL